MKKFVFTLGALVLFAIAPSFAATLTVPGAYATIQAAINVANSGDVVSLQNDVSISSQITITTNGITLDGNGYTITANFVKTSNSNNSAIGVLADNITITDVILDGVNPVVNQLHGINFYEASNGSVTSVTAKNFRTGIAFNSSDGSISNVKTEGSIWHGINVDTRTSQVASVTIAGTNTHNESSPTIPHIWVDDRSDGTTVTDANNKYVSFDIGAGRAYFVDTTKPTATFIVPTLDKVFTGASVLVTLQANDDYQIKSTVINIKSSTGANIGTCFNSGSVLAPSLTANCTINISSYADGRYELRAGVVDGAGNRLTTSTYFIVDKSKPTVAITTPINGASVKGTFVVTGSANDAVSGIEKVLYTVTKIDAIGGSYVANISDGMTNGTGVWDFSVTGLTDGFYRLKVQAFDKGGNWRFVYHDVQVDNTKPVTTVDSPTDGSSFDADFTMNINSTDTGSAIAKVVANLYGPSGLIGPCTNQTINPVMASVDFTCVVDVDTLTDAAYYVKTNAVDAAGNLSNTVTWNFTVARVVECIATTEVCDEVDNDCDDSIDEDDVCGGGEECIATTEVCDEVDNDCDNSIDEDNVCGGGDEDEDVCTDETSSTIQVPGTTSTTTPVQAGTVNVGDLLTISAAGTWAAGNDDPCTRASDANGIDADHECFGTFGLNGDFPYGALVGRIDGGNWFLVGTMMFTTTVTEAGTLELAYRDSSYEDNSGEVSVTITVETEVACVCGDGSINNKEQCDDGNGIDNDGCTNACTTPVCGDGIINQESEQCENSMMYDADEDFMGYCNERCELVEYEDESYCGDGNVDEGEACDDGNKTDTDSCSNECTSNSGGGQASSIGGGSSVGPSSLLETGPEEEAEAAQDTAGTPLSDDVDQVDSSTISACNEDDYILSRLEKLSKQQNTIVYDVPAEYATVLGGKLIRSSSQLLAKLRGEKDTEKRNDIIRAFVCKIEIIKAARGLRHEHIGANSGGDKIDYMLQYLQDLAILQFVK